MKNNGTNQLMMFPFRLKFMLFVMGVMLLVIAGAVLYLARFESYSVCHRCALRQESVAWEIPFVHRTLFEFTEVVPTRLSGVIYDRRLAENHEHDWQFVFGSGNGSPMVFGPSRSVGAALASVELGEFIDAVAQHSGSVEAREWLTAVKDGRTTLWCQWVAQAMKGNTFSNSEEFHKWLVAAEEFDAYDRPRRVVPAHAVDATE